MVSKEIIVSGPAVSKGYMNNPEKTAEAFFEFEGLPAYHTGDVGTMTDEGLPSLRWTDGLPNQSLTVIVSS